MMSSRLAQGATITMAVLCGISPHVFGQTPIHRLHRSDPVYMQQQQMVQRFDGGKKSRLTNEPLILFSYTPTAEDDLFNVSSRVTLPYGTIASLNRLDNPYLPHDGGTVLIPNQPGLFAPSPARNPLERILLERVSQDDHALEVRIPDSDGSRTFLFGPGLDFSEEERDLFMRGGFMHPIGSGAVSSSYGYRNHPFSNVRLFHGGIDFAADFGTPVYAAADGVVHEISREPVLGLSVTVTHRGGYETVYAHLQEATVPEGAELRGGDELGYVGSTGMSTGPHLHFEVKYQGVPRNPDQYILWE